MTIALIILAVLVLYAILTYNGLVVARQRVKEGWSDIDTQLKRRYDLIPNLVETVKGYAKHESETLEKVIAARNTAMNTTGHGQDRTKAENMLTDSLKSIFALSENYPDLKAGTNFLELQREITDTEDKIQASRRFYNTTVLAMNTKVETFPSSVIAGLFRFDKETFFELDEAERKQAQVAPKVSF